MNTVKTRIYTLAPADHPKDPKVLEGGYKLWSTYRHGRNFVEVRSNDEQTAGGQTWAVIARKVKGVWIIGEGKGYLAQASALLARAFIDKGFKVRVAGVAFEGKVKEYKATAKVYSLPSLLNGNKAVVSRDKQADIRAAARKVSLADLMAARAARKEG